MKRTSHATHVCAASRPLRRTPAKTGVLVIWLAVPACTSDVVNSTQLATSAEAIPSASASADDLVLPASVDFDRQVEVRATAPFCCDPLERHFEATLSDIELPATAICMWDFGDGRTANGCRVTHGFAESGTFHVTAVVILYGSDTNTGELVVSVGLSGDPATDDPTDGEDEELTPLTVDVRPDFEAASGDLVRLDAEVVTSSPSVDVVAHWSQTGGPQITLDGADTVSATFIAPPVVDETTLRFTLTVTAEGQTASDEAVVSIVTDAPELHADDGQLPFDPVDATDAIQRAIDSGAPTVVVPYTGQPWIVRPLKLRSDLRLELEQGVVLEAKVGSYRGTNDSLLLGRDVRNLTIVGYGATVRMRKSDYVSENYVHSEWRHGIWLQGSDNIEILGLRVERTGGDGLYIGPTWDTRRPCSNVRIADCTFSENYRQGVSIVSGINVLVEDCLISKTSGTAPQAGLNVEPSDAGDKLTNVRVRNCEARDNAGTGFMSNLSKFSWRSDPVDVVIENCEVFDSVQPGLRAILRHDEGATGRFEFLNCSVDGTRFAGATVTWDTGSAIALHFSNCVWRNVAELSGEPTMFFDLTRTNAAETGGGVEFTNAQLFNDDVRDIVNVTTTDSEAYLDIRGSITVFDVFPETLTTPVLPNLDITYGGGG